MTHRLWLSLGILAAGLPAVRAADNPTWTGAVSRILYRNCVECHRPGEVAPFSLLTYGDAAKRARFLAKTVHARAMPPWLPDAPVGVFLDERRLSAADIATLSAWAEAGAPRGDPAAAPSAPPPKSADWVLGPPDLIVRMRRAFTVPAGPDDTYQVFPVPFSLAGVAPDVLAKARVGDSDALGIAAVDLRAGNPRSLHHADLWIDESGVARRREAAEGGNGFESFGTPGFPPAAWVGGRVPGMTPRFLPPGIAASVMPASGDLVFQIHYRATGKAETDQSEVGLYFTREPVRRVLDSLLLRSFNLDIPPGESHYVINDSLTVPADCALMSIFPHMHFVAREVHASVALPDGTTRDLIDISHWNFKWQDRFVYQEPIVLPKGSVVHCQWIYDNSAANASNPFSPPRRIRFGPNATDEMCALHLGVIALHLEDAPLFAASRADKMKEKIAELPAEERSRFNWNEGVDQ